jgi:cobyrinic acid a,c-diamide synthase
MTDIPRVVIAGLRGGSGKTTLTIGIARALRDLGLNVVCYKKGPDYIDAGWLASASGRDCYNLDPYLIPREKLLRSFFFHSKSSDISLIEGNRGIYDGMDITGTYSTAELAKVLRSPVILVLDCSKVTRTLAAIMKGIIEFDAGVDIRGVILNNIFGSRHESVVRGAIEEYTPVKVLGTIRRQKERLPERHMGLTPHHEHPEVEEAIEMVTRVVREDVDLEEVLGIARSSSLFETVMEDGLFDDIDLKLRCNVKIGVIRDTAFQFYYPENFDSLRSLGVEICEISAINEERLPDIDALYIGGGFPETNAITLSENRTFIKSLRDAIEKGLPVYAECGGLMYLGREIVTKGSIYRMAGIFPVSFVMEETPSAHGYTTVEVTSENPYFRKGTILRGHEFHYSRVTGYDGEIKMAFSMKRGRGIDGRSDGMVYKNVLATYTHLHALGSPEWVRGMVGVAVRYAEARGY